MSLSAPKQRVPLGRARRTGRLVALICSLAFLAAACEDDIDIIFTPTPTSTPIPMATTPLLATGTSTPTTPLLATGTSTTSLTPSPGQTPAPTVSDPFPESEGGVQTAGVAVLEPTTCFDLDVGAEVPCPDERHDLWWQHAADGRRFLVPERGALLAVWGSNPPSQDDCTSAPVVDEKIDGSEDAGNQIPEGTYLCAHTNDDQVAGIVILGSGPALLFEYIVWPLSE